MRTLPHPIPYQGSKRRLAPIIAEYLPNMIDTFYEPFAGSAAMSIFAAYHRRARRVVIADSLEPMVSLLRLIVESPDVAAARYRAVWEGQQDGGPDFFNNVRDRYNRSKDPVDLLYLICRCVKNAVRFSRLGKFTQSVDKRRLGMHPDKMTSAMFGTSSVLRGMAQFRVGDWQETSADAGPSDFVYLDPPYFGTSISRDRRYHQQLARAELVAGLEDLRRRNVPFALSYDGTTGGRGYGPPLPKELGLTRLLLQAGTSSQATLCGRHEQTVESLYVTPGLAEPVSDIIRANGEELGLENRVELMNGDPWHSSGSR